MNRLWLLAVSTMLALATVVLIAPERALAQASEPRTSGEQATSLKLATAPRLDEKGRKVKGQLLLNATLTSLDGKPISNRPVDYYQEVDLLGRRESYLGSAITDSTGVASLAYQAPQTGKQTISLYFAGGAEYAASRLASAIEVAEAQPPFEPEPLSLAVVRPWLPLALAAIVIAVWAVLLGTFLRTVLGIRAAGGQKDTGERRLAVADRQAQ